MITRGSRASTAGALILLLVANRPIKAGSPEPVSGSHSRESNGADVEPGGALDRAAHDPLVLQCKGEGKAEGYPFPERDTGVVIYRVTVAAPQVIQVAPGSEANFCAGGATCRAEVNTAELRVVVTDNPGMPGYSQFFQLDRAARTFRAAGGGLDGGWSQAGKCRPAVSRADVADALANLNNLIEAIRFAEACAGRSGSAILEPLAARIDAVRRRAATLIPTEAGTVDGGDTDYACKRTKHQGSSSGKAVRRQVALQLSRLEIMLDAAGP